jgi:hypothetical protein
VCLCTPALHCTMEALGGTAANINLPVWFPDLLFGLLIVVGLVQVSRYAFPAAGASTVVAGRHPPGCTQGRPWLLLGARSA